MNQRKYYCIAFAVVLIFSQSCKKKEYMPAEIGEKIPLEDTVARTLTETLKSTPYTLFTQAWQRTDIGSTIEDKRFSILVPDNESLTSAGWNTDKIASAPIAELTDLVAAYVLQEEISPSVFGYKTNNLVCATRLKVEGLSYGTPDEPYFLRLSLRLTDSKLSVNGKSLGNAQPIAFDQGYIWPIGGLVSFRSQTAWDFLLADGRFTFFTAILAHNDKIYNDLFFDYNGYYAEYEESWSYKASRYHRNSPVQLGLQPDETSDAPLVKALNTWFIPTDEAFRKAGFQTVDDLKNWNNRGMPVAVLLPNDDTGLEYEAEFYGIDGCLPVDSLLDDHCAWGMRQENYLYWEGRNEILLFSSDLPLAPLLFPVASFDIDIYGYTTDWIRTKVIVATSTHRHNNPLIFPAAGRLSAPGGQQKDVAEPDIYTLNGVIHVMDELLLQQ